MPLKQRVPKLKGFTNPFRVEYAAVNLDTLGELTERSPAVASTPRRSPPPASCAARRYVKVLARGLGDDGLGVKVDVHAHAVSKAAEAAITAAGGTVTLVPLPFKGEGKAGRPAAQGNQFTNR